MVRGFKKTEIGCVPEDWDVKPFGDVFTTLSNNTLSRDNLNYDRGLIKDIHYGDVLIRYPELLDCTREDVPYINHNAKVSCQPLHEGDVVISDTAEDETVGKATEIIKEGKTGVVAGLHTIPCRVKNGEFVPGWLGYFINSHFYHDQLIPYIHGTKVSSIARESLYDTYVVIPPFDEQKRIIQSLSDTDALIAKSERLIKKYQAMKQGFLQHMFPRKGQTAPDLRLPGFTDPWEQRKLRDISSLITKGTTPLDKSGAGDVNFIKVENLDSNSGEVISGSKISIDEHEGYLKRSQLKAGDILFSIAGTLGRVGIIKSSVLPANTNQALAIIRTKEGNINYISTVLRGRAVTDFIHRNPTVGAQPNLSLEQVGSVRSTR